MHSYGGYFGSGAGDDYFDSFNNFWSYSASSGGGGGGSGALLSTTSNVTAGTTYPYVFYHGTYDYDQWTGNIIAENVGAYTSFDTIKVYKGEKGQDGICSSDRGYPVSGGAAGSISGSITGWSSKQIGQAGSTGNAVSHSWSVATAAGVSGGSGGGSFGTTYGKGGSSKTIYNPHYSTNQSKDDSVAPTGPAIIIWFKGA